MSIRSSSTQARQSQAAAVVDPLTAAQFERAVSIVQNSLPQSGSIQSSFEQRISMYALFKQVTVGDVKGARPGLFDMLGRSKWDAWKSKQGISKEAAMKAYVATLLQILKKYKDKPQARTLIKELNIMGASGAGSSTLSPLRDRSGTSTTSSSSASTTSDDDDGSGSDTSSIIVGGSAGGPPSSSHHVAPSTSSYPHQRQTPSAVSMTPRAPSSLRNEPRRTTYFPPPDPSLPPPDVSPHLANPSLPHLRRISSEDGGGRGGAIPPFSSSRESGVQQLELVGGAQQTIRRRPQQQVESPLHQSSFVVSNSLPLPIPSPPPAPPPLDSSSSPPAQTFEPALSLALEKIQASLSALHERLASLELAQLERHRRESSRSLFALARRPAWGALWVWVRRLLGDAMLVGLVLTVWAGLTSGRKGAGRRRAAWAFWMSVARLVMGRRANGRARGAVGREVGTPALMGGGGGVR